MLTITPFRPTAHDMTRKRQYLMGHICGYRIAPKEVVCLTSITHTLRAQASRVILPHRDIADDSSLIMGCFREDNLTPCGHRLKFIMISIEMNSDDYHKNNDFEHKSVLQKAQAT